MSEISTKGLAVPLFPNGVPLAAPPTEAGQHEASVDSDLIIEQARGVISARLGTTPEVAFELLCGLARSQHRDLNEFAAAVVAKRGLDA
jgi:hypothetical protein